MTAKHWIGIGVLSLALLLALAFTLQSGPSLNNSSDWSRIPYQDTQAVSLGEELYQQQCAACHGVNLEGEQNWQQRDSEGYLPAPPHDQTGHTWHHDDQLLFKMIKGGIQSIAGADYKTRMPIYGEQLSDDQIWSVLAYIKSRWPAEIIQAHNRYSE